MGVTFQWLGGPMGYFTDGTLKKEFFLEDYLEDILFQGDMEGSYPVFKKSTLIQLHVSGAKSKRLPTFNGEHDTIFDMQTSSNIFRNISEKSSKDLTSLCHHMVIVESLGRNLFFAVRKSGADRVTIGLVQMTPDGKGPQIVVPQDQESVRLALFGDPETWVPEMIPFLGQLITTADPLLLKAHNETGFMPHFTQITGMYFKSFQFGSDLLAPLARPPMIDYAVSFPRCAQFQVRTLLPAREDVEHGVRHQGEVLPCGDSILPRHEEVLRHDGEGGSRLLGSSAAQAGVGERPRRPQDGGRPPQRGRRCEERALQVNRRIHLLL